MRSLVAALLACCVVGCSKPAAGPSAIAPATVAEAKAKYPPPTTTYQGMTAEQWARSAEDVDLRTCQQGANALRELKAEGVPFLLAAAEKHSNNGLKVSCLFQINGELVADEDLSRLKPFLQSKETSNPALQIVSKAGVRAKFLEPEVKELLSHSNAYTRDLAKKTLATYEDAK